MNCIWCEEPLLPGEPFKQYGNGPRAHWECSVRSIVGSVAHIEERCCCFVPGSTCNDDPALTRRQAAQAAVDAFLARENIEIDEDAE